MKRNIPGYYFDTEKGKYFKIQANHQAAPDAARYAQSEVHRERREHKKQKTERRRLQICANQTVRRAAILEDANTSGVTLARELGACPHSTQLQARDAFEISQMRVRRTTIRPCPSSASVSAIVPLPLSNNLAIASSHSLARSTVEVARWHDPERRQIDLHASSLRTLVGFNSSVVSLAVAPEPSSHSTLMVVCAQQPLSPGNVYWGIVPSDDDVTASGHYLRLGSDASSLWASSLRRDTLWTAIAGTQDLFVLDLHGNVSQRAKLASESRALSWLDRNTVVYGQQGVDVPGGLHLWDLRSSGKASRFRCQKPITSLTSMDDGIRVVASDNRSINLYDTRVPTLPLFSYAHVHQGPQLQAALLGNHLLAALDYNNVVQTYSIRSAAKCGALPSNGRFMSSLVSNITEDGPSLYACQSNSMLWWTRGCPDDDDDNEGDEDVNVPYGRNRRVSEYRNV